MRHWSWHDGGVVLVTNRKVHGTVFADDHALRFDYGDDHARIWRVGEAERGYAWCPGPARRHWGPYGAAGLLPWCLVRDGIRVALCERSAAVHGGLCWSTAGGALEPGELPMDAALREAREELSGVDQVTLGGPYIAPCEAVCGWEYVTYPARLPTAGGTRLPALSVNKANGWKTISVRWFAADELPAGLHPGLVAAWPELERMIRLDATASA
jgi:8-oxo-dGTP pyrophosphatase MutT (NUDIX family)